MLSREVVIVSGARTAIGTMGGSLKDVHQHDLGGLVIKEAVKRAGIEGKLVDEVIVGNVGQIAESGFIGRVCMLKAGLPLETTALVTANAVRRCRQSTRPCRRSRRKRRRSSWPVEPRT